MPIEAVSETDLQYHLIAYDADGAERTDDPDGLMSDRAVEALSTEAPTDVILVCHGWLKDVPGTRKQYGNWVRAMAACKQDREQAVDRRSRFQPLIIGLHWPSLPFGNEDLGGTGAASFAAPSGTDAMADDATSPLDQLIQDYAQRLADTEEARAALEVIIGEAFDNVNAEEMPTEVADAYATLAKQSSINSGGAFAAAGVDREPFDASQSFDEVKEDAVSFAADGSGWGGLLWPLRQLSFWKMKDRARAFGQAGGFDLLKKLQRASDARFHVVGHSFGSIAVSAAVAGPDEPNELVRPIDSLVLLQASMSLWSFAAARPAENPAPAGYFSSILADRRVAGPIVTTQSEFDTALNRVYPMAAGVAGQVSFGPGELPKYGAAGAFGLRGPGVADHDAEMLEPNRPYAFQPGQIYNLESSEFIKKGWGLIGAHNDINRKQVAHTSWQAVVS